MLGEDEERKQGEARATNFIFVKKLENLTYLVCITNFMVLVKFEITDMNVGTYWLLFERGLPYTRDAASQRSSTASRSRQIDTGVGVRLKPQRLCTKGPCITLYGAYPGIPG